MNSFKDRRIVRIALTVMFLTGVGSVLSACNTTEGLGKDVKGTGQAIENSADKNKPS